MSDAANAVDEAELATDALFTDTLERISFQPGILLGSDALTTEQAYHVRRLNRHQRWLIGPGTVFGLRVDVQPPAAGAAGDPVQITVSPGYAIDGLGREVMVGGPYAISLRDWLTAQNPPSSSGVLHLRVTVRAQASPNQLQPVVAQLFDAGLDPVVPKFVADSFALEISIDPNTADQSADAWAPPIASWSPDHTAPPAATPMPGVTLTPREAAMLTAAQSKPAVVQALNLQSWALTRQFPPYDDSPGAQDRFTEASRLLLARLQVNATPPVTSSSVAINNLVRPFVPNILLSALALP
ncbi:MAG: hypothetical protein JO312_05335 [Hyphomicrobiales bacterium]|nr:hypothetical protein [Hyphomicrobiales bacterium]